MRIIREKDLQVLWSWGDSEREHLERTFQQNLVDLLNTVRARQATSRPFSREELQELAEELQQAGELLEQGMLNCFALAAILYTMAGGSAADQRKRQELLQRFRQQIGKKVRVVRTSVAELKNRVLTLEAVHGFKGVLRDGGERWETPIDRLEIVDEDRPSAAPSSVAGTTPGTAASGPPAAAQSAAAPEKPPAEKPASTPTTPAADSEKPPVVLRRRQVPPAAKLPSSAGTGGFGTETVSRVVPPVPRELRGGEPTPPEKKPETAKKGGEEPPPAAPDKLETAGAKPKPKLKPLLRKAAEDTTAVLRPRSRTEQARALQKKKVLKYTPRLRKSTPPTDAESKSDKSDSDA